MTTTIKLAYHTKTKQIIHVEEANNGLSCDCSCVLCHEQLEARQGHIRDWHFKHHKNVNCTGGQETALHRLGKQILVDNCKIVIPEYGTISYSDAVAEKEFKSKFPDVTATFENEKIFFEILVTHKVDSEKEQMFVDGQTKSVEIDLRECTTSTFEEIKSFVLDKTKNKRVIFWEPETISEVLVEPTNENLTQIVKKHGENWYKPILYLAIAILIFLGFRSLSTSKRSK